MAPNFSAFTTPSKVIAEASAQGVKALGISSFFDQQVYRRFADEARAAGPFDPSTLRQAQGKLAQGPISGRRS